MKRKGKKEELLIENFIVLQKILTNLTEKIDKLAKQVSELLKLFEQAAKSFEKEKEGAGKEGAEKENELIKKLNEITEQNKTIARTLLFLEERLRGGGERKFSF